MENKNIQINLLIQQILKSDNMAYAPGYIASNVDVEFRILDNTYQFAGKHYARLKTMVEQGKCGDCIDVNRELNTLLAAPEVSLEFLGDIMSELSAVETPNYDPNNYFGFMVANCIMTEKPGFSKTDGYMIELALLDGGNQEITFTGPLFESPLVINSSALSSLLESDTSMVVQTPDINLGMSELLVESQLFTPDMVGENKKLSASAKISEQFIVKFNGQPDYEIIDIGGGKGRNVLRYDMDKIERKINPFINAEVAGLLSAEQEAVAAWNVFLAKQTSMEEDDQMTQDANAAEQSWSYQKDLPLDQNKKEMFAEKYKLYFIDNYLKQFLTNKFPSVEKDAAVFDLEEGRQAKVDKVMGANKQN
tara:strand:+ start:9348 stop:10439 length:1092 start_codon:yes stop_codon:yes gene_type:complete